MSNNGDTGDLMVESDLMRNALDSLKAEKKASDEAVYELNQRVAEMEQTTAFLKQEVETLQSQTKWFATHLQLALTVAQIEPIYRGDKIILDKPEIEDVTLLDYEFGTRLLLATLIKHIRVTLSSNLTKTELTSIDLFRNITDINLLADILGRAIEINGNQTIYAIDERHNYTLQNALNPIIDHNVEPKDKPDHMTSCLGLNRALKRILNA